ncbi:hypothetical protein BGW36DRAFT_378166 [Talaromyces proteolyticus]|uniref:Pentatricopeptide repeat protein n=1 Tax=Talaromyces proteolyticus TaxID=1131652 RepID=A0AAD4KVR8_9EURO|nr:uncharacterized protein BGW36DRAFT_378166 [Talaromyces proteolyticus]KAH8697194.1 hypothetical protein BGW36DRAFT_378166 [Talaromyces proteolyticus]
MPNPTQSARPAEPTAATLPGSVSPTSSRAPSMFNRDLANFQKSLRCLRSRRRSLGVETIADIFIQSLVVAGFCADHSPRSHIFSATNNKSKRSSFRFCSSIMHRDHQDNFDRSYLQHRASSPFHVNRHSRPLSTYATRTDHKIDYDFEESPDDDIISRRNTQSELMATTRRADRIEDRRVDMAPQTGVATREKKKHTQYASQKGERKRIRESSNVPALSKNPAVTLQSSSSITEHLKKNHANTSDISNVFKSMVKKVESGPRHEDFDLNSFLTALDDKTKSNQFVFNLYKKLPPPGVLRLSKPQRSKLLRRFAQPPDRRRSNARYYLFLIQEMIDAELPLSRSLWTSAIYFTAHKVPVLQKRDLQDALELWRRMEKINGIQSDDIVFELLFTIAVKSGQFAVADRLMEEMTARGIRHTRHGMVSKIYYCGQKHDIDGIHEAFEEFVRSGEVIDTAVLNCLLSSLLRAGQLDTAEQLYSRMIQEHKRVSNAFPEAQQNTISPSLSSDFGTWRKNAKRLGSTFERYASLQKRHRQHAEHAEQLQNAIPLAPDTRTFFILFGHHCLLTGDLKAICVLIRDMEQTFPVPPRTFIYYFLFQAFARHNGTKGWTKEKLQEVWKAFRRVLYESYTRLERLEIDGSSFTKIHWENPIKSSTELLLDTPDENEPDVRPVSEDSPETEVSNDLMQEEEELLTMFDNVGHYWDSSYLDENMPRRLENAVFLSRELNIVILKAFGAHAESEDVLHVFTQIERIWKPWKRLPSDAQAVKNELQRQLIKTQKKRRL